MLKNQTFDTLRADNLRLFEHGRQIQSRCHQRNTEIIFVISY